MRLFITLATSGGCTFSTNPFRNSFPLRELSDFFIFFTLITFMFRGSILWLISVATVEQIRIAHSARNEDHRSANCKRPTERPYHWLTAIDCDLKPLNIGPFCAWKSLETTGVRLWTWLRSRRPCHEMTERERWSWMALVLSAPSTALFCAVLWQWQSDDRKRIRTAKSLVKVFFRMKKIDGKPANPGSPGKRPLERRRCRLVLQCWFIVSYWPNYTGNSSLRSK